MRHRLRLRELRKCACGHVPTMPSGLLVAAPLANARFRSTASQPCRSVPTPTAAVKGPVMPCSKPDHVALPLPVRDRRPRVIRADDVGSVWRRGNWRRSRGRPSGTQSSRATGSTHLACPPRTSTRSPRRRARTSLGAPPGQPRARGRQHAAVLIQVPGRWRGPRRSSKRWRRRPTATVLPDNDTLTGIKGNDTHDLVLVLTKYDRYSRSMTAQLRPAASSCTAAGVNRLSGRERGVPGQSMHP